MISFPFLTFILVNPAKYLWSIDGRMMLNVLKLPNMFRMVP